MATLQPTEVARGEREAIRDLAATARCHVERLPFESEWREPFFWISNALPQDDEPTPSPGRLLRLVPTNEEED